MSEQNKPRCGWASCQETATHNATFGKHQTPPRTMRLCSKHAQEVQERGSKGMWDVKAMEVESGGS